MVAHRTVIERHPCLSLRVIGPEGALLVRPDRFVAWRNTGSSQDPAVELASALTQILARPIGVPAPAAN